MLNTVDATPARPYRHIFFSLLEHEAPLTPAESAPLLRNELAAIPPYAGSLPPRHDQLSDWLSAHAQMAADSYRTYVAEREQGAPRRHFGDLAQVRQFLGASAPAWLADGASLYGIVERWDDGDFEALIAHYLDVLGHGVPDRNRVLQYRALLEARHCSDWRQLDDAHFRSAAIELALAQHGDDYLPELIGWNLARQQPSGDALIARHELNEFGLPDAAFPIDADTSAAIGLRGVLARVADPAAFYARAAHGYALHDSAALKLPQAVAEQSGTVAIVPRSDAAPAALADASEAAPARPQRAVIRHHFPADEHAWETIGSELRLLEARLAASDSKEEAMATLIRLMSPAAAPTPAGLMASRVFSQIFNL